MITFENKSERCGFDDKV